MKERKVLKYIGIGLGGLFVLFMLMVVLSAIFGPQLVEDAVQEESLVVSDPLPLDEPEVESPDEVDIEVDVVEEVVEPEVLEPEPFTVTDVTFAVVQDRGERYRMTGNVLKNTDEIAIEVRAYHEFRDGNGEDCSVGTYFSTLTDSAALSTHPLMDNGETRDFTYQPLVDELEICDAQEAYVYIRYRLKDGYWTNGSEYIFTRGEDWDL